MALKKVIIIASFGSNRDMWLNPMLVNVRSKTTLPIVILTDMDKPYIHNFSEVTQQIIPEEQRLWMDNPRWGVRNTNYWLAKAALNYELSCCLNDDMRICTRDFEEGFDLAKRFGICVPMNPRIYVKYNARGADTTNEDWSKTIRTPFHVTACNMSPMFVSSIHPSSKDLLDSYLIELQSCMRGTLAFWFASWNTGITPLYLPEQWCVCASNAKYIRDYKKVIQGQSVPIEPIMLHWGQQEVRNVFKDIMQ